MKYLSPSAKRQVEVTQNYEVLMNDKKRSIKEHFEPLDYYYDNQRS